jgi:mannose-6-phosphate isomerase-like protein (cupin superfamily)
MQPEGFLSGDDEGAKALRKAARTKQTGSNDTRDRAMRRFETKPLGQAPDAVAPDGSAVRLLLSLGGGSFAHFELPAGAVSRAVAHRTVEEIWYFVSGSGEVWRRQGEIESVIAVAPGVCLTIPLGAHFQFRADPAAPLAFVAATMPPWPGDREAFPVEGRWLASAP